MNRVILLPIVMAALLHSVDAGAGVALPPVPQQPVLHIGGFSDFDFQALDDNSAGSPSGFREGQLALHLTSTLANRFSFFGEISFTPLPSGFSTEVERSILQFHANDYIGLSFGRFHTPINWWNVAFHHGQWLQTSINRPEMTRFGGAFIPVHFVGVVAEGVLPGSGFDIHYGAGVGNGRSELNIARAGDAGDANNHRAWYGTLAIQPDAFYAMDIGGGYYRDLVGGTDHRNYREDIAAAHVVWARETPEVIAEMAWIQHDATGGGSFRNWAYYVQSGYRLPWFGAHLKPYGRAEEIRVAGADPVFTSRLDSIKEYTGGVRWDVSDFTAIKTEYRRQDLPKGPHVHALLLQVSFGF